MNIGQRVTAVWTSLLFLFFVLMCPLSFGQKKKELSESEIRQIVEYGDFYLVEQDTKVVPYFSLTMGAGSVLAASNIRSRFASAELDVFINRFFGVTGEFIYYRNSPTDFLIEQYTNLVDNFKQASISVNLEGSNSKFSARKWSTFVKVRTTPFSGNISFFGVNKLPLNFKMHLGFGKTHYEQCVIDLSNIAVSYEPYKQFFEIMGSFSFGVFLAERINAGATFTQIYGLGQGANTDTLFSFNLEFRL
jgi:hypothetical protein